MNSFRVIIASLIGIIAVVVVAVVTLFATSNRPTTATSAVAAAAISTDRSAPRAASNLMAPVVTDEASRRAELHGRLADEQLEAANRKGGEASYVAPPVVTTVRSSTDNDALTRAIFEDKPEPEEVKKPEPEPVKPEPTKVVEKEPEPAKPAQPSYMRYYSQFEKQFQIEIAPVVPDNRIMHNDRQSNLLLDILNFVGSAIVSPAYADTVGQPLSGVRPNIYGNSGYGATASDASSYGNGYNVGTTDLYGSPDTKERSAARPTLVGIDSVGRAYGTQEYQDSMIGQQQQSRVVLARAGDLVYARLMFGFNSDDTKGMPIYAIVSDMLDDGSEGPLHNARVEGRVSYTTEQATISFNRILLPDGRDIAMTGMAISADAARTGVAQKVNKHRLWNYGALFLSGLMEGVGNVVTAKLENSGDTIVINTGDGTTSTNSDTVTDGEMLAGALGPVGEKFSNEIERGRRATTMSAPAGYIFGIVFLNTLVYDPATAKGVAAYNPRTGEMTPTFVTPNVPGASGASLDSQRTTDGFTVQPWSSSTTGAGATSGNRAISAGVGQ